MSPTYNYTARDLEGRNISGSLAADSDRDVAKVLRERGLLPQRIALEHECAVSPSLGAFLTKILVSPPLSARMIFFRMLSTMLRSGMTTGEALGNIASQGTNRRLRKAVEEAYKHVSGGGRLSETLKRYPWLFAEIEIALVEGGEVSGGLDRATTQVSEYLERELETRRRFSRATFYPKAVLLMAFLIPPLPVFVFGGGEAYLRALIAIMGPLAVIAIIVWLLFRCALQNSSFATAWDTARLGVPVIGSNVRKFALAKFARATGTLYSSGVPIAQCVETGAQASGNRFIKARLGSVSSALRTGETLHDALARSGVLTSLMKQMVATGHLTGDVDEMLNKIAEYYEAEAEAAMDRTAIILGILALFSVAVYIAMTLISGYKGLFDKYYSGI